MSHSRFKDFQFLKGAVSLEDCPNPIYPEIAFAGRSNVGKSSLINAIVDHHNIARTSNTPGKTRQMNYYLANKICYFVDLPGYGFAKVPEAERKKWGEYIKKYLIERENLMVTAHLIDIRHKPTKLDEEFIFWMASHGRPFIIVLNKADKITFNKQKKARNALMQLLQQMNIDVPLFTCSAYKKEGISAIRNTIFEFLDGKYELAK